MGNTVQTQAEKMLEEVAKIQEGISDQKIILSNFKKDSPKLKELARAKKGIADQMKDEKDRIEDKNYEDKIFEEAMNETLTLKDKLKEKSQELRTLYRSEYKSPQMISQDKMINGEQMSLLIEFVPVVTLKGKKLK